MIGHGFLSLVQKRYIIRTETWRLSIRRYVQTLIFLLFPVLLATEQLARGQTFDSTSTGADGALSLTTPGTYDFYPGNAAIFPTPVDPQGDNVYHFTTITIGTGVTVRLSSER